MTLPADPTVPVPVPAVTLLRDVDAAEAGDRRQLGRERGTGGDGSMSAGTTTSVPSINSRSFLS